MDKMNSFPPLVSVVIPYYNSHDYIKQCLESVLLQSYSNIEIIVVDDGSDSKSSAVLEHFRSNINVLLKQENKGQSTARNVGIQKAKGEYIFVLDSDDYLGKPFFDKSVQLLMSDSNVKLVSCYANLVYPDGSVALYKPKEGVIKDFLFNNQVLGTSMFRKKDWLLCGKYDESMRKGFEDWEFFIRLLNLGGNCVVLPEIGYNYRKRLISTTSNANKIKYDLLKYIYFKHTDLYKENFIDFVTFLLKKIEREEIEKSKMYDRIEYKVGNAILRPIRLLKKIFYARR